MNFEQLNPNSCKTYLVTENNLATLIDPVLDHFADYLELIKSRNLKLTYVIDTHTHADHISACAALKDATDCSYIMYDSAPPKCVNIRVQDGEVLEINGVEFKFIYTPGHTQDSMSIVVEDKLFTGDFLFLDDAGAGRDDLPGGSPAKHWDSLKKISTLEDKLMVYPAHEYRNRQPSTLGNQRKTNPHLQKKSSEEFVKYLDDLRLGPAEWMKDVLQANYACAKDPNAAWIPIDTPACEIKGTIEKGVNEIEVKYIIPENLDNIIKSDEKNSILLDVREEKELNDQLGHIEGIINIPIGYLTSKLAELKENKNDNIIVICRSGGRATTGAQILMKAGFNKVKVLEGGMISYRTYEKNKG